MSAYLGLPEFLRRESRGLGVWLDDWFMRKLSRDASAARRAGAAALESMDKMTEALGKARKCLAAKLEHK